MFLTILGIICSAIGCVAIGIFCGFVVMSEDRGEL